MCNRNLQQNFTNLLTILRETGEKELQYLLVRFLLHCHMPQTEVWSSGVLLSRAIESGCEQYVRALREAGCPVRPYHLHLLMKYYSPSLFCDLLVEPECALSLLSENLVKELIAARSWRYLQRYEFFLCCLVRCE
ncbi:hypothetical protein COOONC_19096 [Cooperia oncophora]